MTTPSLDTNANATTTPTATTTTDSGYSGRVKWFNNKYGYGFVTVLKTDADALVPIETDVFAHHSEVKVSNDQYRYLVQGEYVAFDIVKTTNGKHEYQCANVKGMYGGQLICETRHEARVQYKSGSSHGEGDIEASCYGGDAATDGRRRFAGVKPPHADASSSSSSRGGGGGGRGGFRR